MSKTQLRKYCQYRARQRQVNACNNAVTSLAWELSHGGAAEIRMEMRGDKFFIIPSCGCFNSFKRSALSSGRVTSEVF